MKNKILGLGIAGCFLATAYAAAARDDEKAVPDHTLSEFKLGDHVSGEVDLSDQEGKVVVIEYWGTR